jgi:hypothetical protein
MIYIILICILSLTINRYILIDNDIILKQDKKSFIRDIIRENYNINALRIVYKEYIGVGI